MNRMAVICFLVGLALSCANKPTPYSDVRRGSVQDANIIVKNNDSDRYNMIYISRRNNRNGTEFTLSPGETGYYMANRKGEYFIIAYHYDTRGMRGNTSDPFYFTSAGIHTFIVREGSLLGITLEEVIDNREIQHSLRDAAISNCFKTVSSALAEGSKIAIINISSNDRSESEYIIEELSVLFVNSRKFTVVDRRMLDAIRQERNFQLSGEVDDNSIVSIGHFLGANVVLTGSISGEGEMKRLRLRALDVRTAQVLAMASERI